MTDVRALAAHMISHMEKMPDKAILTEEELEIDEVKAFLPSQYINNMYGKISAGYVNGSFVLFRKTEKHDDAFALAKLMKLLGVKSVTLILKAERLCKADVPYMEIRDFIRLYDIGTSDTEIPPKETGGIYAISKGRCTCAEKRAISLLGADGVGESILPVAMACENIDTNGIMIFDENFEISRITGGEYEPQI